MICRMETKQRSYCKTDNSKKRSGPVTTKGYMKLWKTGPKFKSAHNENKSKKKLQPHPTQNNNKKK